MASTMAPPPHEPKPRLPTEGTNPAHHWPSLVEDEEREEWEMVSSSATAPVVSFDAKAMAETSSNRPNPKFLKHSQSSPDLRGWSAVEDEDEQEEDEGEDSSAVMIDEEATASSSVDLVSGPHSVWSMGSAAAKLNFKDAILQQPKQSTAGTNGTKTESKPKPKKTSFKATFVVVKPESPGLKRNFKSMGNLQALDHIQEYHVDEEILGDTDATCFYSQKEKGAKGRANGQKIRPDEAKRLEITMNKKKLQKERQRG